MKKVKALFCSFIGHRYRITLRITQNINEYKCSCCGKEVTDNAEGKLTTLTQQFRELNIALADFSRRRSLYRSDFPVDFPY